MFFVKRKVVEVELVRSEDQNAMIVTIVVGLSFDLVTITVLVAPLHRNVISAFTADGEDVEVTKVVNAV